MLMTKTVEMRWNSKNKAYYESRGYTYTRMKDTFLVNVEDLKNGSNVTVKVKCDYCGREFYVRWYSYYILKKKDNKTDCCSNPECTAKKSQESLLIKYGVTNAQYIDGVKEKTKQTNILKYGVDNPFKSDEIKEKIKSTNIEKYGVPFTMQNEDIKNKSKKTCLEKYGVENYGEIYSRTHTKELSPFWKGGTEYSRVERATIEYREWRKKVFERDLYTCACCGCKNGNGKYIKLVAHHIKNWKDNIDSRYDVDNGVTLCEECHIKFHSMFGKRNNTFEQLEEFLDKKIC